MNVEPSRRAVCAALAASPPRGGARRPLLPPFHSLAYSPAMRLLPALLLLLALAPLDVGAGADARTLSFHHTHTGERLRVEYFRDGRYRPEAMKRLKRFLADFRNGKGTDMDPRLFDILYEIRLETGSHGEFEVISAYRSPETNEMLRARGGGVAKKSQHLHGRAIDVRLTDVDTATLRDVALSLAAGGVGYYRDSDFVHIDTGRVRRW